MVFDESSSDEVLMQAYQNGDNRAFELLFQRHSSRVYGFLLNQLKDRAQADDVFQGTFLKLHKARRHYDPSFPFGPWLFTVCKSVLVDHFRRKGRNREDLREDLIAAAVDERTQEKSGPAVSLEGLPANQRVAIELRFGDELSFEAIAKKLETSPANVRQLVSRGIQKLRSLRAHKEHGDDDER